MIGLKFVSRETLKLEFVVTSDLGSGKVLVMNYGSVTNYHGNRVQVLTDAVIMSKDIILKDYIEFDSPDFHKAVNDLKNFLFP